MDVEQDMTWLDSLTCPEHGARLALDMKGERPGGVPWPEGRFVCPSGCAFPVVGGVPRFTGDSHYADAFGHQWKRYRRTQLDSYTGVPVSLRRLEGALGAPLGQLRDKKVLECGSGAGRFTELLIGNCGLLVSVDPSVAVEANLENCGGRPDAPYVLVSADINRSPLPKGFFDVGICLGVLQHTPSPLQTLRSLAAHLKPGGTLVVDHYARPEGWKALGRYLTLAYPLREVLKRLDSRTGLRATIALTAVCDPIRRQTSKVAWIDRIACRLLPTSCYYVDYPDLDPKITYEWNELDTHDHLTDYYKHLTTKDEFARLVSQAGLDVAWCDEGGNGIEVRAVARGQGGAE